MINRDRLLAFEDWLKPLESLLTPDEVEKARTFYKYVVNTLNSYAEHADKEGKEITIELWAFTKDWSQWISDAEVKDQSIPERNEYNWHLRNTSQLVFNCGLLFDERDREFSMHT